MDPYSCLHAYIAAARAHGAATESGNDEAANKHYDELMDALRLLRASTSEWPGVLQGALANEHPHVRCWAATHLLTERPVPAASALEALASQRGIAAFNAKMVLREWRAGRLQLS